MTNDEGTAREESLHEGERHTDSGASEAAVTGATAEAPGRRKGGPLSVLKEIALVVVLALVLSSLVKTFLVQPFWIPSDSMNDTLIKDDRVIVSKWVPAHADLQRGDIVVFEDPGGWLVGLPTTPKETGIGASIRSGLTWVGILPSQEDNHLIKRVIGLPGDHVVCCDKQDHLTVNGTSITEPYLFPGDKPSQFPFDIHVPAGKVWVMGDHRSNSRDSRYNDLAPGTVGGPGLPGEGPENQTDARNHTGYYGSVPIDHVVGKGLAIVWPLSRGANISDGGGAFASVPAPAKGSALERSGSETVAAGPR